MDTAQDIALVKLPREGYHFLPLEFKDKAQIGTDLFAFGAPLGEPLSFSVSKGIVSGLREIKGVHYVQTDASLNHGNSGGPLLNKKGEVVGIVSCGIEGPGISGVAFGVPLTSVAKSLNIEWK